MKSLKWALVLSYSLQSIISYLPKESLRSVWMSVQKSDLFSIFLLNLSVQTMNTVLGRYGWTGHISSEWIETKIRKGPRKGERVSIGKKMWVQTTSRVDRWSHFLVPRSQRRPASGDERPFYDIILPFRVFLDVLGCKLECLRGSFESRNSFVCLAAAFHSPQ